MSWKSKEWRALVDRVDMDDLGTSISILQRDIQFMRSQITDDVKVMVVENFGKPVIMRELQAGIRSCTRKLEKFKNSEKVVRRNVLNALSTVERRAEALEEVAVELRVVHTFSTINKNMLDFIQLMHHQEYTACMRIILQVEKILEGFDVIPAVKDISSRLQKDKQMLLMALRSVFAETTVIVREADETVTLTTHQDHQKLQEAMRAQFLYDPTANYIQEFCKSLHDWYFIPILKYKVKLTASMGNESCCLKLSIISKDKPNFPEIVENMQTLLKFLKNAFDFDIEDSTALTCIGEEVSKHLIQTIMRDVIEPTIPSTVEELSNYQGVRDQLDKLQAELIKYNILKHSQAFCDYVDNIDILFLSKNCPLYHSTAKTIMEKDLHDLVEVGEPLNLNVDISSHSTDSFPLCSVSRNVTEYMKWLETILLQIDNPSSRCIHHTFSIIKDIISYYITHVPEFNKILLETIPQHIAVFFNNINYIVYTLRRWCKIHHSRLSEADLGVNSFESFCTSLTKIADDFLENFISTQLKQIELTMKESGLSSGVLTPVVEKHIRQCLRQQEVLRSVWHSILPQEILNKTLGKLLNMLCSVIIEIVLNIEVISEETSKELVILLQLVVNRGPEVFTDPTEVHLFVASWFKFKELICILGSNLSEIKDRWCDGKGLLALHFRAKEVQMFLMASFQDSRERSSFLKKLQAENVF